VLLKRIFSPGDERERAMEALRLNDDISPDFNPKLLATSSTSKKPTVRIKRLSFSGHSPNNIKLNGASSTSTSTSTSASIHTPTPTPIRINVLDPLYVRKYLREEREKAEKALRLNVGF
jgi:hypothetical protein